VKVFLTGFPGFVGRALLPRILARTTTEAVCLVQPKFAVAAANARTELVTRAPELEGRIHLVEGDVTRAGLGLPPDSPLTSTVTEVWHLAAVYDLAVSRELGMLVNVEGTQNVLAFATRCDRLDRFHYFSTCYVSGRLAGVFREDDLERPGPFNNFYEETKNLAERRVREHMAAGLPATIYRPSIIVGDSTTGQTHKFDGPYFVMQWLLRQPKVAVLPVVGDPTMSCVNVIPVDFLLDAVTHLSGLPHSAGRTYQLADPHPLTVAEMIEVFGEATGQHIVRIPLPRRAAKAAIRHIPGLYGLLRIPAEAVDYFVHPTSYLTDHADLDLSGTGIVVPAFPTYADRLVAFRRGHPEVTSQAMV
jgi:nucleoside-diphosphate-sugar epimerase